MMKKLLLFLFLSGISLLLFSQDTINQKDPQGNKTGFWRKINANGEKIYEGHFKAGVPVGEFRYFYPDGKLKTLSVMSSKGHLARTTSYFPTGKKMAQGNYLDEKKDSLWMFYSETADTIVSEEFYRDGQKNGVSRTFYPRKGVSELTTWKNGIQDGLWEEYYTSGKIKLRASFTAGQKEGPFKTFYETGKVMMSGQYTDGRQAGTWDYFDDKGLITKKEYYRNGMVIKTDEFTH
jgi:antitoxin component YwqK of YwqJK toxin-antitoxin module